MKNEHVLSRSFWETFCELHLEKSPLVLKQPFASQFADSSDVFKGLVNASEQYREGTRIPPIRFYVEHAWQQAEIGRLLVHEDDASVSGYAERITRELEGRQFGLIVNDYHAQDQVTWFRLRRFLLGLYELVGMPPNQCEVGVFFGNYDKTPFGLHKDPHSVFTFIVEGRKRILAWPDEVFRGRPKMHDTLEYEQFRDQATVLEGEPGDVLYWPSSHWHVAESTGGLSLTISFSIDFSRYAPVHIFQGIVRMLQDRLMSTNGQGVESLNLAARTQSADRITGLTETAVESLNSVVNDPQLQRLLQIAWLNHVTGFGFNGVPSPLPPRTLLDEDIIQGDPDFPLMWLPIEDNEVICSANGHSFSITAHPNVAELFAVLNQGNPHIVKRLLREFAGTARIDDVEYRLSRKEIRALLEKLCSLRALMVSQ